jgi:hypothetical protein
MRADKGKIWIQYTSQEHRAVIGAEKKKQEACHMKKEEEFHLGKESIQQRYEELRQEVLTHEEKGFIYSKGLALFNRQGMAGWLQAWSQCIVYAHGIKEGQEKPEKDTEFAGARRQIIMIVANMILSGGMYKNFAQEGLERCA